MPLLLVAHRKASSFPSLLAFSFAVLPQPPGPAPVLRLFQEYRERNAERTTLPLDGSGWQRRGRSSSTPPNKYHCGLVEGWEEEEEEGEEGERWRERERERKRVFFS